MARSEGFNATMAGSGGEHLMKRLIELGRARGKTQAAAVRRGDDVCMSRCRKESRAKEMVPSPCLFSLGCSWVANLELAESEKSDVGAAGRTSSSCSLLLFVFLSCFNSNSSASCISFRRVYSRIPLVSWVDSEGSSYS